MCETIQGLGRHCFIVSEAVAWECIRFFRSTGLSPSTVFPIQPPTNVLGKRQMWHKLFTPAVHTAGSNGIPVS